MQEVKELMLRFGLAEDDVMDYLLGGISVPSPGGTRASWKVNSYFGLAKDNDVSSGTIYDVYAKAGFCCSMCGSSIRLTMHHIDGNPKNHDKDNLAALCLSCNKDQSKRPSKNKRVKLKIYRACRDYFEEHNKFPGPTFLCKMTGLKNISGYYAFYKQLQFVFTGSAEDQRKPKWD